jgi:hypothetical protein
MMIRLLICALLLSACQKQRTDESLRQAGEIHLQALQVLKQVEKILDSAGTAGILPADTLASLRRDVQAWRENLVEVPGLEHHDHDHSHDHQHEAQPPVSSEEMLRIQRHALQQVQAIQARLQHPARPL